MQCMSTWLLKDWGSDSGAAQQKSCTQARQQPADLATCAAAVLDAGPVPSGGGCTTVGMTLAWLAWLNRPRRNCLAHILYGEQRKALAEGLRNHSAGSSWLARTQSRRAAWRVPRQLAF